MEEQHYTCPSCGGTSDHAKTCDTEGCAMNGQDLKACTCTDGLHADIKSQEA